MPSERDSAVLTDILTNIDLADSFIAGLGYDDFVTDIQTFYAVTRCLEIFRRPLAGCPPNSRTAPQIPWRKIAGSGNIYRHNYEDVLQRLVWGTVKEFLPTLRAMAKTELSGRPEA